jgi:hypothetical protein
MIALLLAAFALMLGGIVYTPSTFPIGLPAINTYLMIGNGNSPETFNIIANIGDLTGPSMSGAVVDVTSHSSAHPWREKLVTLLDTGDITFPIFYIPASTGVIGTPSTPFGHDYGDGGITQFGLEGVFTSRGRTTVGNPYNFAIQYPDASQTTDYFTGFVSKFSKKAAVAGVEQAEVTISLTGMPTLS